MDLEPPMGDLSTGNRLDAGRSRWARRTQGEGDLPINRIIHQRVVRLHGPARLDRLGLRPAQGYHKCGSRLDLDWVVDLRVWARVNGTWTMLLERRGLARPRRETLRWFALKSVVADAVVLEVRRCGIDGGWTPWNLVMGALVLEGERLTPLAPRKEQRLELASASLTDLPKGVEAEWREGAVHFRTADYEVGFRLDRPGWTHLGLGIEEPAKREENLLFVSPVRREQGLKLHVVGEAARVAPSVRCDIRGTVRVDGATVTYDVTSGGQHYRLAWTVEAKGLTLRASREARRAETAWHSAAWAIGWRNSVAPTNMVGELIETGQTGGLKAPTWVNAPGIGTWLISSPDAAVSLRSECRRADDLNLLEIKLGEKVDPRGLHVLSAGRHEAVLTMRPLRAPTDRLRPRAPAVVKRALERTFFVAPTFRPDVATLSNSGASMPCAISFETWTAVLPRLGLAAASQGGPSGEELLRVSLERWLQGGPAYAAGILSQNGRCHDADDEYLMTGAAALRAVGDYLSGPADEAWWRGQRKAVLQKIAAARLRDLDGDGLIESPHRTGVSGTGQWSTCWADVISFGWKCAWSNAVFYGALRSLAQGLRRWQEIGLAEELEQWAALLRSNYKPTFWNEATGWLAGWRCQEGKLHDHAFPAVNGAAVQEGLLDRADARAALSRMLAEMERVGMPDPAYGLPLCLWQIGDHDLADIIQGYPLGYYQNGGRTHSQSRRFVMGLYAAGLRKEADQMLERLCVGFAEAQVFGGNNSGVDWRTWQDERCGYEGLLTDQFSVLEAILERWGRADE